MNDLAESSHHLPAQVGKINGHSTDTALVLDAQHIGFGTIIWRKAQNSAKQVRRWREKWARAEDVAIAARRMNEQLAVVTHELRNSVGAIRFATRLIEMNQHQPTIVERARVIIDRQASQMSRLIEDLLEVSLVRSGRFCLQRERVDLRVVAKQVVESIEPEISHRFQRLTVALPEAPVWLQADPGRLAQVLVNLLSNATKYTDKRGELRLSIEREASWVTVRVRDSGIGITRDVLPHVFEPFMQAESSVSRSEMGIGLGLALVSSIVELHGGRVTAASAGLGKGSEFTVQLPANSS
jgi:signal transduction histidine kinase